MICFKNITREFTTPGHGTVVAVRNLTLTVAAGETLCLIGPSGCGKTTTMKLVNLPPSEFAARRPGELSGGQRQRVGVARALALDPAIILMDEPFGALDPITRDQLHDEFVALKAAVRKTIILVTHDMREAFKLGDRIALMDRGEIVQIGSAADFRAQPASPFVETFLRSHLGGIGDAG